MSSEWIFDISSKVFTYVQYKVGNELSSVYPNIQFTTSSLNQITKFPTVYVHELAGDEVGKTIDEDGVSGVKTSFQIEVYSDKSQDVCRRVAKEVVKVMKDLHYTTTTPTFNNESTTYRLILRFSRTIGSEDIF